MEEKIQDAGSVGQAPRGYWILITGQAAGTNRYAWSQVNDADTGFGTSLGAGFAMSGTSATTGWPAYEINGRQDVPADSTVRVLAFPSAAGTYWVFEYAGTAGGPGTAGTYPGWYMGLTSDACLLMTVLSAAGFCSSIDTDQIVYFEWTSGLTWDGIPDFVHDTGSGAVQFVISNGEPHLTIDAVELGIEERGNGYLIFAAGGTTLCNGTAGECTDNTFRVRIECTTCYGGTPFTGCCPYDGAATMSQVLRFTITNSTGSLAGNNGVYYVPRTTCNWSIDGLSNYPANVPGVFPAITGLTYNGTASATIKFNTSALGGTADVDNTNHGGMQIITPGPVTVNTTRNSGGCASGTWSFSVTGAQMTGAGLTSGSLDLQVDDLD